MSFTSKWVQVWVDLPRPQTGPQSPYIATVHWFNYTGTIDPATYNFGFAAAAFADWVVNGANGLSHANLGHRTFITGRAYFNYATGNTSVGWNAAPAEYPHGLVTCPYGVAAVVRRLTASNDRRSMGRFFVAPLPLIAVRNDLLIDAAYNALQAAANSMVTAIAVGGITYRPCVCSYSDHLLKPITQYVVQRRVGFIYRRSKGRRHLGPGPGAGFKIPPT